MLSKLSDKLFGWLASKLEPYLFKKRKDNSVWRVKHDANTYEAVTMRYKERGINLPPPPQDIKKWSDKEIKEWKTMVKDTHSHIKDVIKEKRKNVGKN